MNKQRLDDVTGQLTSDNRQWIEEDRPYVEHGKRVYWGSRRQHTVTSSATGRFYPRVVSFGENNHMMHDATAPLCRHHLFLWKQRSLHHISRIHR